MKLCAFKRTENLSRSAVFRQLRANDAPDRLSFNSIGTSVETLQTTFKGLFEVQDCQKQYQISTMSAILEARLGKHFTGPKNEGHVYLEQVFGANHDAIVVEL